MKTSIRIVEHFNTGGYEWKEIAAEVEADINGPQDLADAMHHLDAVMNPERRRVLAVSTNPDSMIHEHPALS